METQPKALTEEGAGVITAAKLPAAPLSLVLFGSPGSGKGTQSKLLMDCLGIPQISTGDMLREEIRRGTAIGRRIEATMRAGSLVSDQLVNELVADRIREPDCAAGYILDGYPRTLEQGEVLIRTLAATATSLVVIHLIVDYNVIIERITARRQCPRCGTLYNTTSRPPRTPGICDLDGDKLVVREDDRESVVRERLDAYERQTCPLIDFFRRSGCSLHEIDASRETPRVLAERICGLVRQRV